MSGEISQKAPVSVVYSVYLSRQDASLVLSDYCKLSLRSPP